MRVGRGVFGGGTTGGFAADVSAGGGGTVSQAAVSIGCGFGSSAVVWGVESTTGAAGAAGAAGFTAAGVADAVLARAAHPAMKSAAAAAISPKRALVEAGMVSQRDRQADQERGSLSGLAGEIDCTIV